MTGVFGRTPWMRNLRLSAVVRIPKSDKSLVELIHVPVIFITAYFQHKYLLSFHKVRGYWEWQWYISKSNYRSWWMKTNGKNICRIARNAKHWVLENKGRQVRKIVFFCQICERVFWTRVGQNFDVPVSLWYNTNSSSNFLVWGLFHQVLSSLLPFYQQTCSLLNWTVAANRGIF